MNQLQSADPATLTPNPWNTNVVSPDNEEKLEASIRRRGMFKPVIVRELADGSLQILGGAHRAQVAARIGLKQVPIFNLGQIDDTSAKEIGLLDNARYGADDTLQLAELLEGLGTADELASFMPYSETDLASIFSSINIAFEDLDLNDEDEKTPILPKEKPIQTHVVMRFKVPVDDQGWIVDMIEKTMKRQKLTEEDSLTNAGDALVHLLKQLSQE